MKHLTLLLCLLATVLHAQEKDNPDSIRSVVPPNPIKSFLSAPIKSLFIYSRYYSCAVYNFVDRIEYLPVNDSIFKGKASPDREKSEFPVQYTDIRLLNKILTKIDEQPAATPGIRDFAITPKDKEDYLALAGNKFKTQYYFWDKQLLLSEYKAAIKVLDVITIPMLIPDGFMGKELFDNKILIRQIADYMYGSDK